MAGPETVLPEIIRMDTRYEVRLPRFEGPLDLLLHLIKKEQIDIYDIPIARITEQYLAHIQQMQEENITLAGEFVEMAATLIYIKSRTLLPPDLVPEGEATEEADPMQQLIDRLVELDRFKNIAQTLYSREQVEAGIYYRSRLDEVVSPDEEILAVSLYDLVGAFKEVLRRFEDRLTMELEREQITVAEQIERIQEMLKSRRTIRFSEFTRTRPSRLQLVVLFMALLELARMKAIGLRQEDVFAEILIIRRKQAS